MKRPATAVAASAALLLGAFLPLAFSNDAQAAPNCTSQLTAYNNSVKHVAAAQKKAKRAQKLVRKAVKHHAPKRVIRMRRDNAHVKRVDLRFAKMNRNHAYAAYVACHNSSTPQGTGTKTTPTTSPTSTATATATSTATTTATSTATTTATSTASSTSTATSTATATSTSTTTITNPLIDLLGQLQSALAGAGAPAQLTDAIKQLQAALSTVPAGVDPAAYQKALTDAFAQVQAEIAAALANPGSMTAAGLLDDIINPIASSLSTAGVPVLPDTLTGLRTTLDSTLGGLGLGFLAGALQQLPTSVPTTIPTSIPTSIPTDASGVASIPVLGPILAGLAGLAG